MSTSVADAFIVMNLRGAHAAARTRAERPPELQGDFNFAEISKIGVVLGKIT